MATVATTPAEMNTALTKILVAELHAIANGKVQTIGVEYKNQFESAYITALDLFPPKPPRIVGRTITIELRNIND